MPDYPETPMLDKMLEIKLQADVISSFLEYCEEQGWQLCKWHEKKKEKCGRCKGKTDKVRGPFGDLVFSDPTEELKDDPCMACFGDGYFREPEGHFPISYSFNRLLHMYFEIDEKTEEQERRKVLEYVRTQQTSAS